jgi:hypothetical protein
MPTIRWITFHRWLLDDAHAAGAASIAPPPGAEWWHVGPDSPIGPDGARTGVGRSWGGAGFFADRAAAEAVIDDPDAQFDGVPPHSEAFHCLLVPIRFAGSCNWLEACGGALEIAEADPGGPVAVMTSAGYEPESAGDLARISDFRENVDRVRAWYDTLEGNIVNGNFMTGVDGMTFSLWRSDAALRQAAYGPGVHRAQLDRQQAERMADRTSYTRSSVLRCAGVWNGAPPLAPQ